MSALLDRFYPWLILVVAVALFLAGYRVASWKCDAAEVPALKKRLAENMEQLGRYEIQLADARRQHAQDVTALVAAAARPVPGVVCHRPRPGLPAVPGPAAAATPKPGGPADLPGSDFEPGPDLRANAARFATALEVCYDALDRWPKKKAP